MKIRARYDSHPVVSYDGDPAAVAAPAVRQRLRLAETLAGFGPAEWDAASRCAGWTNRDVVVHLESATRFWVHTITQARRGTPTRMLAGFDPVATPAALVAAAGEPSAAEVLDGYARSARALAELLGTLTAQEWALPAESPLGHVSVSAVVRHALWDAWVHERDVALGVGIEPPVEPDEVDAALRCVAALGPAFGVLHGELAGEPLAATVTTTDPDVGFTVTVDGSVRVSALDPEAPVAVRGPATGVLDGLSLRAPLDVAPGCRWLTTGLGRAFDAGATPGA